MSIVSVVERFQDAQTTETASGYTHTRIFRVMIDAPSATGHHEALQAEGIPRMYELFPIYDGTQVINRNAKLLDANSRLMYQVQIDYGIQSGSSASVAKKPWEKNSLFDFDFVEAPEPLLQDFSTPPKPVLNSSGDFFENQLMQDKVKLKIMVRRARLNYDPDSAWSLLNTLNPDQVTLRTFGTFPAKKLKLRVWKGTETEYTNSSTGSITTYFDEYLEFLCDGKEFVVSALDAGFYATDTEGKKSRILDENGKPKVTASLLNGAARVSDTPVYLDFKNADVATSWGIMFPI